MPGCTCCVSQSLDALDPGLTLVEQLTSLPGVGTRQAREALARFFFERDAAFARTGDCGGGERCRVALARLLLQPWDALLLDEPTNHLDMPPRAGGRFGGTILVASHDRFFLDRTCWRLWVFGPDGIADFDRNHSAFAAGPGPAARPPAPRPSARRRHVHPRSTTFRDGHARRLSQEWKAVQAEPAAPQAEWRAAVPDGGGPRPGRRR